MYVLLYINAEHEPCFIQGTMAEINDKLRTRWINGDIDKDDWAYSDRWQLLGIEDGMLTPMGNVECTVTPHFEVY